MTLIVRLGLIAVLICGVCRPVAAEDATPKVSIVLAGGDALTDDLSFVLGLTSKQEQKQLPVLLDYLEIFQIGIDGKKPICIDLLIVNKTVRIMSSFPVTDLKDFKENLDSFGIAVKRKRSSLYQLSDAYDGFMRYQKRNSYASISEELTDVPVSLGDPRKPVQSFLDKGIDLGVQIVNPADQQDQRRSAFQGLRKEITAGVKSKPKEAAEDFALRKLVTEHQMAEVQRFFVESAKVSLGWTTDDQAKLGRGELSLAAIPETSLAASIALLGQQPSHFANIADPEKRILGGRLHHPLDSGRQQRLGELFEQMRGRFHAKIKNYKATDAQKVATDTLVDNVMDMLAANAKAGLMDAFVHVIEPADNQRTIVGGVRVTDGTCWDAIVKLLPTTVVDVDVETDVAMHGDIKIHKLTLTKNTQAYQDFLGTDPALYVGACKDVVWYAAGANAVDQLKQAITAVAEPAEQDQVEDTPFFSFDIRILPWLRLRQERVGDQADSGNAELRKLAMEAFSAGDDLVSMELSRAGDDIAGRMQVATGILRLAGKLVAQFSKENLDE
ncbi:MAG: hypothetical protein ABGZ17_23085 [Planctomycetaceae bacterium]